MSDCQIVRIDIRALLPKCIGNGDAADEYQRLEITGLDD